MHWLTAYIEAAQVSDDDFSLTSLQNEPQTPHVQNGQQGITHRHSCSGFLANMIPLCDAASTSADLHAQVLIILLPWGNTATAAACGGLCHTAFSSGNGCIHERHAFPQLHVRGVGVRHAHHHHAPACNGKLVAVNNMTSKFQPRAVHISQFGSSAVCISTHDDCKQECTCQGHRQS